MVRNIKIDWEERTEAIRHHYGKSTSGPWMAIGGVGALLLTLPHHVVQPILDLAKRDLRFPENWKLEMLKQDYLRQLKAIPQHLMQPKLNLAILGLRLAGTCAFGMLAGNYLHYFTYSRKYSHTMYFVIPHADHPDAPWRRARSEA